MTRREALRARANAQVSGTLSADLRCLSDQTKTQEDVMGFGRGLLLWLIGIPLPIIILIAIFMHH
jgi:hypothetical protein